MGRKGLSVEGVEGLGGVSPGVARTGVEGVDGETTPELWNKPLSRSASASLKSPGPHEFLFPSRMLFPNSCDSVWGR